MSFDTPSRIFSFNMMWMADDFFAGMAAYVKNRRTAIRQKE